MNAANYRYLEFISSFDDHSKGNGNLTKVTSPIMENERLPGLNFFAERDLQVLESISREEYMTFGMQRKDIRQYLGDISSSAMSRIFKRLRLHGVILKEFRELVNIFRQPTAKLTSPGKTTEQTYRLILSIRKLFIS